LPLSPFQDFVEALDNLKQFVGIGLSTGLLAKLPPFRIGHSFLHEREEAIRSLEHILFSIEQWPVVASIPVLGTALRRISGDTLAIPFGSG
jgi:hypothetical protein